jgi:hypothetical protein
MGIKALDMYIVEIMRVKGEECCRSHDTEHKDEKVQFPSTMGKVALAPVPGSAHELRVNAGILFLP